jgi:hypothetical protein
MCQPFGFGNSWDASTGGYHHRQRVCQPSGLEKAQRLQIGFKPENFNLALGPEGRYNLDLDGRQNLVTLGCVSPSGLAVHGDLQPVVTTTGRGYASPSGLRKAQRPQFGFKPKCRSGKTIVSRYASSDCSLCSWDYPEHRLTSQQDLRLASSSERQAVPYRPSVQPRCPSVRHSS